MTNSLRCGTGPRRRRVCSAAAALLAALALTLTGCRASKADTTGSPPPTAAAVTVGSWKQVVPGGDCQCADGGKFSFWDRPADPTKVVFYLNGGGVCWTAEMCAFTSDGAPGENTYYDWDNEAGENPDDTRDGFFDLTRTDNPFAGYSVVYLSSCTGDAHLGNTAQKVSPTLTVQHRGLVNGTAALDYLAAHYPNATQVVVIGKTAGSVAAPLYGGLVADRLPHAKVVVFGAQSGAWPDNPDLNTTVLANAWGAYAAMPAWAIKGLSAAEWGVPEFWIQVAHHVPGIVLSRFDFAYDPHAAVEVSRWMPGNPPNILSIIDATGATVKAAGVTLHSYTAPSADHGILEYDKFYTTTVKGVRLVDWLRQLTSAKPPGDVHCDQCGP